MDLLPVLCVSLGVFRMLLLLRARRVKLATFQLPTVHPIAPYVQREVIPMRVPPCARLARLVITLPRVDLLHALYVSLGAIQTLLLRSVQRVLRATCPRRMGHLPAPFA